MYLFGSDLPKKKKIDISLKYCYGFGEISRKCFVARLGYNLNNRISFIQRSNIKQKESFISLIIKSKIKKRIGMSFKQKMFRHFTKIKKKRNLRALRHSFYLPVRGQHTRKNAQTSKAKRINRKKIAIPKKKK